MFVNMSFETLDKEMATVTALVSEKNLSEDLKNLVLWVKDGEVRFCAYNAVIASTSQVDATVEYLPEEKQDEQFVMLKAKDLNDVIGTFKGLRRTVADKVSFEILENSCTLHVNEIPIEEGDEHADLYKLESKFRITKPILKKIVQDAIKKIKLDAQGVEINSGDLLFYLDTLYPTVQREVRESTNSVLFGDAQVYTALPTYFAFIKNALPDVLSGFKLTNSTVNFLRNYIALGESFSIHKELSGKGAVELTVKVGHSVASISCFDMSRSYDMTSILEVPENGVVVNKDYLMDVIKRIGLSSEPATVKVTISGGIGQMEISSKSMNQVVPVLTAKGEGEFIFQIKADLLSSLIFSHAKNLGDDTFFYLEEKQQGGSGRVVINMAVKDRTDAWLTKIANMSPVKMQGAW